MGRHRPAEPRTAAGRALLHDYLPTPTPQPAAPDTRALDIIDRLPMFDDRDRITAMNGTIREPRTPADYVEAYRTRLRAALATHAAPVGAEEEGGRG